jgi:hypothetical protein
MFGFFTTALRERMHSWHSSHGTEESNDPDFHHDESATAGQDNPFSISSETGENATSNSSIDSTTTTLHTTDQANAAPRSRKHVVAKRGKVHMRHVNLADPGATNASSIWETTPVPESSHAVRYSTIPSILTS